MKKLRVLLWPLPGLLLCFVAAAAAQITPPTPMTDALAGLESHPRFLAPASVWRELEQRRSADPLLQAVHETVLADARGLLEVAPVRREMEGRRLLGVSRTLVQRLLPLAYAWRTSGEPVFLRRAEQEMLAAAEFSDWNPSHFLDVAEATTAVAIAYDWCFEGLEPTARARIRQAIIKKGIRPGLDPTAPHNSWHQTANNWNQVCFAGMVLGALAVAEDEPELAKDVLQRARAGIRYGLEPYEPDGVYPEGPNYWAYGTTFHVLLLHAVQSALGQTWNEAMSPAFLASAGGFLQCTAPSGNFYNFADGSERAQHEPALYWFAQTQNDPGLLLFNHRHLQGGELQRPFQARSRFFALVPIWWPRTEWAAQEPKPSLSLRWLGQGVNPIGVFRESWNDPRGFYLAFKGGAAELNHAHMDAGSFILELNGVRWAVDLGAQSYESLESKGIDLWNRSQESQRWSVYRLNNYSHSTLTIGGQPHRVGGYAQITAFQTGENGIENPFAIVEASPVFAGQAESVRRGFQLLPGRAVLVQDEVRGLRANERVRWQLATRAEVTVQGRAAVLRQSGETLHVALSATVPGEFQSAPAEPPADGFNAANPGVTLLFAEFRASAEGTLRLAVRLAPEDIEPLKDELAPLATWPSQGQP